MKAPAQKNQSLRIVGLFCLAVGILIGVSLLFKLGAILTKSTFDGTHRFTMLQKSSPVRVYSFAPDSNTITILDVTSDTQNTADLQKNIKIPIDAVLSEKVANGDGSIFKNVSDDQVENHLKDIFFAYDRLQTNMTVVDIVRLWLFTHSIRSNGIVHKKIEGSLLSQENKADNLLHELFTDETIASENKSIQVINGTGVSGFGSEFSRILANSGATVISVTTARKEVPNTTIKYFGSSSYTVQRIEKILKEKANVLQKKGISDIIITLGKDKVGK